jgi:hypothetical protein
MASSEWFFGGRCFRTAEKFRRIRRCALQLKSISPVANIQVAAIYALRHKFVRGLRPSYQLFANRYSLIAAVL